MGKRQVSFFLDNKLWKEFTLKCVQIDKKKTEILVEMIKKFLGKK